LRHMNRSNWWIAARRLRECDHRGPRGPIPTPRPKLHLFVGFRTDGLGPALQSGVISYRFILVFSARWSVQTTGLFASATAVRKRLIVRGVIAGCTSCSAWAGGYQRRNEQGNSPYPGTTSPMHLAANAGVMHNWDLQGARSRRLDASSNLLLSSICRGSLIAGMMPEGDAAVRRDPTLSGR
jgi:hypothetical protein